MRAWGMLALVYFASFMAPLAQFKLPPLASWLIPSFGLDGVSFGYLMSALSVIGLVLAFPASFICGKFGLKRTMLVSLACLAIGTAIPLTESGYATLYVGRLIEGIGIGLVGVAAPTCISVWFPESTRGLALGIWATWFPVGNVVIFNTAPLLALSLGWRSVFVFCLALCVIAFILFALLFKMPTYRNAEENALFSVAEGMRHLKNRNIWLLGATFFVFNFIQLGVINSFYNTYLEQSCSMSASTASSLTSLISLISIVAIPLAGAISDHVSPRYRKFWIAASYLLFALAFVFAWRVDTQGLSALWVFIAIAGISSGLSGGVSRPMTPIIMNGSAVGVTMGMGTLQLMQNLGAVVGAPLFGWGWQTLGWEAASNLLVVPICILAAIASLAISVDIRKRRAAEQPSSNGE